MKKVKSAVRRNQICFIAVFLLVICLTSGAFLVSHFHDEIFHEPCIEEGVLDLSGWNPEKGHVIHLDGEWEFFWNRWIVTGGESETIEEESVRDALVPVPAKWTNYTVNGERLPASGIASYRIHVINCPETINLVSYLPNYQSGYSVYFNDSLTTSRGMPRNKDIRQDIGPGAAAWTYISVYSCSNLPQESNFDLTIEVTGENLAGLTLTPILTENEKEYLNSSFRYALASIYFGVMLISLIILASILHGSFRGAESRLLYFFNILMFLRVLLKDEFFGLVQIFLPFRNYYVFNNVLKVLTLMLPFIFFFYVMGLMKYSISKEKIVKFVVYESVVLIGIILCMRSGNAGGEFFLSLASLLPFISMLIFLYRSMTEGTEEILPVALCLMFLMGSLSTGSLYRSGLVVLNLSMVPPTFFLAFIVTQDYIFIHKIMDRHMEVLEAANLRLQLKESQTTLVLSQIKPHFLYNALVAIQVLCTKDPKAAQEAIMNFSQYLRANMSSISSSKPIPFEQELNHIRNYTAIEKLRFQSRLKIHYDIQTTDFKVPPLTIEPLVENGIKHGATKNVEGGNVWLATWETEDSFVIRVTDDGPGFDVSILGREDLADHGLNNIIFRLKQEGAEITFESQIDRTTEVTVMIPKDNGKAGGGNESDYC